MLQIERFKVISIYYASYDGDEALVRIIYDFQTADGRSKGTKPVELVVKGEDKVMLDAFIDRAEELVTEFEEKDEIDLPETSKNKLTVVPPPDWMEQMEKLKGKSFTDKIEAKLVKK